MLKIKNVLWVLLFVVVVTYTCIFPICLSFSIVDNMIAFVTESINENLPGLFAQAPDSIFIANVNFFQTWHQDLRYQVIRPE
jgi:hypothetical protein